MSVSRRVFCSLFTERFSFGASGTQDNGGITRSSRSGLPRTQALSPSRRDPTTNEERTSSLTPRYSVAWRPPRTLRFSTTCWKTDLSLSRHQHCCSRYNRVRTSRRASSSNRLRSLLLRLRRQRKLSRQVSSRMASADKDDLHWRDLSACIR